MDQSSIPRLQTYPGKTYWTQSNEPKGISHRRSSTNVMPERYRYRRCAVNNNDLRYQIAVAFCPFMIPYPLKRYLLLNPSLAFVTCLPIHLPQPFNDHSFFPT